MRFALVLLLLLALAAALFATQDLNMEPVRFAIPYTDLFFTGPRLVVVGTTFLLGFALGYLATLPGRIGAARRARRAEKRLEKVDTARGAAISAEAQAAEARAEAAAAHRDAEAAHHDAEAAHHEAEAARDAADLDAAETQRLADEVARRTAGVQRDVPPPPPER
ncbi:MAG: hypothetical protein R3181_13270 [Rubricoccaceae bacterium]|nr:hypothetical protein [Rubricoccaceae bacterium]